LPPVPVDEHHRASLATAVAGPNRTGGRQSPRGRRDPVTLPPVGWKRQFDSSLDRYLRDHHRRLDELLDALADEDEPERESDWLFGPLVRRVFAAQAAEAAEEQLLWWTERRLPADSPPQDAMFVALTMVGRERFKAVYFAPDRAVVDAFHPIEAATKANPIESYLVICPECEIARYRVDFLLRLSSQEPFMEAPEWPERLETEADRHGYITKELVVEVDGHDFHDRTKAQASRDRERDRTLQRRDLPVARYTGSDIWRDAFRCADDALDLLHRRVMSVGDVPRGRW
jgi:hypothetical protein